ncbi:MAG: DEAD/DEAH box helicase [Myxococcales bacterium]|nr:DEAD/DEAH box helicase [Myxococcales bacterium]
MSTFARLNPRLQEAIVSRLGWSSLRPVQELAGEALLDGHNAVVLAPTAGGKTEASMFPTLSMLMERPPDGVGALYIAPIKALLNNQAERLGQYTQMVGMDRFVWHGDAIASDKKKFVREPCELLMTTPESLEVMLVSSRTPVARIFRDLRIVVVDEIHALAGTDRGAHFMSVLERIARYTDNDIQRVGLSATVGNPDVILKWLAGTSKREGQVIDPPKQPAKRELKVVLRPSIAEIAAEASREAVGNKSLFFCESRSLTESVADRMRGRGTAVFVHHSSVSQQERAEAERNFHEGSNACIACTSTLELGIDVGDLNKVLQANAPSTVSSFLQRMGRTGRRPGTVANTSFYVDNLDVGLQAIALIELAKSGWVESVPVQTRCWPVMVHQLLAMTLQFGGVPPDTAWEQLCRVGDLSGIRRDEFDHLLSHMMAEGYLHESGGRLAMGDRAERVYGRKNFMELYAVFSSPVLYKVQTAQEQEIGSLEQGFVDSLVEDMTAFLLGGRAWIVEHINHADRKVRVHPAPRGKKPSWGGYIPQMLGFELCQRIRRVLEEDTQYPYAHPDLLASLNERREELGDSLRRAPILVQIIDGKAHCWTFAGGRINQTLRYIFALLGGFKVVADNFQLRLEGDSVTHKAIDEIIERMRTPAFWTDRSFWSRVMAELPEYRLSKFQRALPPEYSEEMVAGYLLDLEGTRRVVVARPPPAVGPG